MPRLLIDRVKAYKPGPPFPAEDPRALVGVLLSDRSATKGLVATIPDLAPRIEDEPSIKPYVSDRLRLIDEQELIRRLGDRAWA
jgi:hypothetical protein